MEREVNSGGTDDSESEPWYVQPAPQNHEACGKPFAGETAEFVSSEFQKSQNNKGATLKHFLAISPQTISLYGSRRYTEDQQAILWRVWT